MFDTVLVADRGLVACRVVRTCQRLGARAVTVHSAEDERRLHATCADESLLLGASDDAYLDGLKVIEAAGQAGAQAVHPGSGFLARIPGFAQAVLDAGLVWVGPPPAALAALEQAPSPPATGQLSVMLLAPAGGPAVVLAESSRTDGLWSAPAPLTGEVRDRTRSAAVDAAARAGLVGLAAVDVRLGGDGQAVACALRPWLSFDHAVLELVTGVDLVAQQLLLAAGKDVGPGGAAAPGGAAVLVALRARAPGRLTRLFLPDGEGLRVEAGCREGEPVSPADGVLVTLAARGTTESQAQHRLAAARDQLVVDGIELEETL